MDDRADFEQAQLEQERLEQLLSVLQRVENWKHTCDDVSYLASELGILKLYQKEMQHEMAR